MGQMTELQSILWFLVATPVGIGIMLWGTFAMIHSDEAKGRKRALQGAGTEDLKRVERELDEVRRELRKRQTPDG